MIYARLADLVLIVHLAFLLFVGVGGFAVLRWPALARVHVPSVIWGVLLEYAGWVCPLTPLEVWLRRKGGGAGYEGGFIDHYVSLVVYPEGLSRSSQIGLGTLVLAVNVLVYWRLMRGRSRSRNPTG